MKPWCATNCRKRAIVKVDRIAAWIFAAHPDVVIAGNSRLPTGNAVEQFQTALEVLTRTDVAGEDQEIGRIFSESRDEIESRSMPGRMAGAKVKVGRDRNA